MPVQRTYVAAQVKDTRQIEIVEGLSSQNPGQLMQWQAGKLAEKAAQNAAAMAVVAEDKAIALAKAAIIPVDILGMPKPPDNVTEEMGSIARRTWDANIYDRTAQLLNTAVTNQINVAGNDNQDDLLGFVNDVNKREQLLRKDLPPEMEGAFSNAWSNAIVGHAAKIGHRRAVQEKADSAQSFEGMVGNWTTSIKEAVLTNNPLAPQLVANAVSMIRGQKTTVVPFAEQQKYINNLYYEFGNSRALNDNDRFDSWTADAINEMIVEVNLEDASPSVTYRPFVEEYFPKVDSQTGLPIKGKNGKNEVDWEASAKFVNSLYPLLNQKRTQAAALLKTTKYGTKVSDVIAGNVNGSPESEEILNQVVANATGRIGLTPDDWLGRTDNNINEADLISIMAQAKQSGFLPSSLRKAYRQLDKRQTPEMFEALYDSYHYLANGPVGSSGNFVDMTEVMSDRSRKMFELINDFSDDETQFRDALDQAAIRMTTLDETQEAWELDNKSQLSNLINDSISSDSSTFLKSVMATVFNGPLGYKPSLYSEQLSDQDWVKANPNKAMKLIVRNELFSEDNVNVGMKELDDATRIFEVHLRDQLAGMNPNWDNPFKTAMELTEASMSGRFVDTEYMNGRSAAAPEKHYRAAPPLTYMDTITKWGKMAKGFGFKGLEIANPAGVFRFLNFFGTGPNPDSNWATMELGADEYIASTQDPFALISSEKINELLANGAYPVGMKGGAFSLNLDAGLNRFNREFLRGGKDYILVPNPDTGKNDTRPTYRVMMNNGERGLQFVVDPNTDDPYVLDVRPEFDAMNKAYEEAKLGLAFAELAAQQQSTKDIENGDDPLSPELLLYKYLLKLGNEMGIQQGSIKIFPNAPSINKPET